MSDKEEIDTSNEDKDSKNREKTSEGNLLSLDSNKNNSAISENVPQSAAEEGSGDDLGRTLQENLQKPEDPETVLIEKPKGFTHTKAGTDSGDHTGIAKVNDIGDKNIENINIDSDAKLSEMNVITDKAESNIGFHEEIDDEDMELRWDDDDDDDGNNLATDDDNTVAKIDEFLSEDQLLEESSDVITKKMSEIHSEIPKSSEDKLESDILKGKSIENIQTDDKSLREIDTTKKHDCSLNLDIPPVKAADEKSLEEESLKETDLNAEAIDSPEMDFNLLQEREDLNTEAINSPEMDFDVLKETDLNAEDINSPETKDPIEECVDQDDISFPEEEIMEESETQVITPAEEIVGEKAMVEKLEESETDSAIQEIAEVKTFPKKKIMVEEVEEIHGEKHMIRKLEESETDRGKQLIAQAKSLLEEKSMVEEVEKSEMSSAKHLIVDAKSLPGEKVITEVEKPELNSEMLIAETKESLGEKSIEKEVEELEISSELQSLDEAEEILVEESMIRPKKVIGPIKINLLKKVIIDKPTKEIPENIIEKDQLLAVSQSTAKAETTTFKMSSFTDVILSKENDDVLLEQNLLKEAEERSSVSIPKKVIESSIKIPEKVVPMNKEDDDVLLEDKLLEDTEIAEVIPESDVTMEVDDDKEGELLKEDNRQDDSCTFMDVDITDQSIEEQARNEDKIVDQSMGDQSGTENKTTAHSIDDQTNVEKVNIDEPTDEVKSMEQSESDEQANTTEKIIEQTINVEAKKTVEFVKDTPSENESKSEEKVVDEAESEKENVEQVIADEKKMEENKKEQLAETNISEQITKSSEEPVSNTSDVITEDLDTPATDNTTLEAEIKDKIEPETPKEITESVNKDTDLDKPENIKEIVDPVTSLDKNDDDEVSPKDSSIFFEDSPGPIKTDHGLHKPDVMLEIPSQELIDIDETDFSMNLDQSDLMVNLNDVYEETEHEKTVDETVPHEDNEKTIDQSTDVDTVKDQSVEQTHDADTIIKKSVDLKAKITETIATEDITAKDKSGDQEDIVAESTVSEIEKDSEIVENDKKVKETVVEATIEENMEKMFADNEPDAPKEVPQSIASTSQAQQPSEQPPAPTQMTPDTSDEVPDISDSLGLLAESAGRIMEDDEEPDDDDDADDDDDFDNDESSNQISAEQSEDSNPAALDTEPAEQVDQDQETPDSKDEEFPYMVCGTSQDKMEKMDVEDAFGTLELQAVSVAEMAEEAESAVDALNADTPTIEQAEEIQESAEAEQMDIETVKLSDTSDNEIDVEPTKVQTAAEPSKEGEDAQQKQSPSKSPRNTDMSPNKSPSKQASSPSKLKNLLIGTQAASSLLSIVDLEESSSEEDDIQEVQKQPEPDTTANDKPPESVSNVTNVNIPTGIEIMCTSGGSTSEITTKEGEVVISGVPKPPPHKPARLNTSEVSIKTVSVETMVIPETKMSDQPQTPTQSTAKLSLEIFSLDSDDEDNAAIDPQNITTASELDKARETSKCINYCCKSDNKVPLIVADASVVAYYDGGRKRRCMVCQPCADVVADRTKNLIQGIKDLTPLLHLEMSKLSHDLVEISDSESEDEDMTTEEPKETIGEKGAKFIEDNLAKYLNDTWKKYDMDVRLKETQIMLDDEIEKLEQDSKEIDAMLNECQAATDRLRCELYASFECRQQQLPALIIHDTPDTKYIGLESAPVVESIQTRQNKRRLSSTSELPAKRPAIPLGYAPLDGSDKDKTVFPGPDSKLDDDKDISVVKLSAEAAPAELPPPGEISRPPLRVGMPVYAMKNAFGPWLKGKVLEIQPKNVSAGIPFSLCRVKFDHKTKTNGKVLLARCIAYSEPADVRMTIGTRLIALFKDTNKRESYYSGVVAEIPNPVNNYRYLVFFDDGYAQYVQHQYTRLVCESSPLVWEEVHPFSREFVREYLLAYPERPMVRLHEGQHLKTEWNGKWWSSRVTRVDASLAQVLFVGDGRREWVYRGSTRLAPLYLELRAAERHRPRPMPRSKAQPRLNMPYVEYTRSDEPEPNKQVDLTQTEREQQQQREIQSEEIRRQRAVAKKSTSAPPQVSPPSQQSVQPALLDSVTSRVVYYTPKNAVRPLKMVPHKCSSKCKRTDVLSLKELKSYNPLAKPLLSGWERQIVRYKGHREVMYRAPCGRRLRNMRELHHYLRTIDSDLPVDLFDFHYTTHCLAEFLLNKCVVMKKDLSHGKENVPVPCVNYYDDSLPEFCSYNTERTPTAGVPLNLEPEFLCGCDCTDDCQDKSKCACWKMTLEGARTIGLDGPNVGYVYRRLPEPLPSGIYECNSRCKCKHTCLNRVAQHPLQLKLQVFKTPNRGWGIRALNDVPKGSFLCVYAGNLLTDATANLDGLNEGDEYLAELDYIEVVEQMKEGYEEDIPEADKKLDKKEGGNNDSDEDEPSSEDEETASKTDKEDDDFRPGYIGLGVSEFNKRLRKREKSKKDKEKSATDEKEKEKDTTKDKETKEPNAEEDCITISDDEEVREPSRFMAQTTMGANEYISKYKSVRTLFGKDEACYIMDAKVQGNIGRYLNHSCCPNVFVQNVFVDTHDPRFPWVAFFALSHIKAGTELTWNYNYDVGSVPGKVLYCYCGAANCRGRLL